MRARNALNEAQAETIDSICKYFFTAILSQFNKADIVISIKLSNEIKYNPI